jgi:histidyl-tRNA synthetase
MNDISPTESATWHFVEATARSVLQGYGYREVRPPLVERSELFRRSVGEATDIVEKEMYTFSDRNGESLSLRPECTASCVRAAVEHGWLRAGGQRIWTIGPMFRYEKPQKGRYRQFHQLDVEALGFAGPDVDAELILICARLWRRLGLSQLRLELNSLGSRPSQARYRDELVRYFASYRERLDVDSCRRLVTNPLRILDSKKPEMQELIEGAPRITDYLDEESARHLEGLTAMLDRAGMSWRLNPRMVRGLDYYTGPVFEWQTEELGAQNAVCGGGRYDRLIEDIGGRSAPATGFAMGLERIVALLEQQALAPPASRPDAYLVAVGIEARREAHRLAETLRDGMESLSLTVDADGGSFKTKLRRADRSGARYALILGDEEVRDARVGVKALRKDGAQTSMGQSALTEFLRG